MAQSQQVISTMRKMVQLSKQHPTTQRSQLSNQSSASHHALRAFKIKVQVSLMQLALANM
jgi:hypothetical protein